MDVAVGTNDLLQVVSAELFEFCGDVPEIFVNSIEATVVLD